MRRGISGGQKKRMTTEEMVVGGAKYFLMDEISTRLDRKKVALVRKGIAMVYSGPSFQPWLIFVEIMCRAELIL